MDNDSVIEHLGAPELDQRFRFNPLTGNLDDDYEWRVRMMIEDARNYNDDYRAPRRELCMEYYLGLRPDLDQEGRSTFVATEARDTILSIMPSLMRIFTAREHVCEYIPNYEAVAEKAEEATDIAHMVFMDDNPGFMIYHNWFKDALTKGEGAVKWRTDANKHVTYRSFMGLSKLEIALLLQEMPNASVERLEPNRGLAQPPTSLQIPGAAGPNADQNMAPPSDGNSVAAPGGDSSTGMGPLFDVTFKFETPKPKYIIEGVPPDEFRVDRRAKSIQDAVLIGQESIKTPSQLREMGYAQDVVDEFAGQDMVSVRWNVERSMRNPALDQTFSGPDVYGAINFGEYYIRVDKDGDGVDELRRICVMGNADTIVTDEVASYVQMAFLTADPEPHTLVGHSITELVEDLQRIKSNLMRAQLDSIASTIYPRIVFNELMVNTDDILNDELGAPIRAKDVSQVQQLATQFIGDAPNTMINYLDMVRMQRTGISDASKGLDPKALQSTAVQGVDMVINGAQERIELIARILAETGVKDLFKGILIEMTSNPNPGMVKKVRGKYITIDPSLYDPTMPVRVNPALGRSSDRDRMQVLMGIAAQQEKIVTAFGPSSPFVKPQNIRNVYTDLAALGGVKDISRYFPEFTDQDVDQFMQAMSQGKTDPMEIQKQIEDEKQRSNTVKHISDDQFRRFQSDRDEKFRRDKLASESIGTMLQAEATAKVTLQEKLMEQQIQEDKNASAERVANAGSDAQGASSAS